MKADRRFGGAFDCSSPKGESNRPAVRFVQPSAGYAEEDDTPAAVDIVVYGVSAARWTAFAWADGFAPLNAAPMLAPPGATAPLFPRPCWATLGWDKVDWDILGWEADLWNSASTACRSSAEMGPS
ncbi:MAG: hypothetical protein KDA51_17100, partial [Planctomycetales bacterium]|nr:hypothetical protein [Planctomycetales bacterium]